MKTHARSHECYACKVESDTPRLPGNWATITARMTTWGDVEQLSVCEDCFRVIRSWIAVERADEEAWESRGR